MPYPLPLTRTEAYLAYKAGVIQQSDLKPSLAVPRNGIDAWLAYWTGLSVSYPKKIGRNLFDAEAIPYEAKRAYNSSGAVVSWSGYTGTYEYQPVEPNTQYTIWNNKISNTTYLCEYDENKNFIRRLVEATTFTTTASTHYLRWSLSVGSSEVAPDQTMLVKGSSATPYEPYTSTPLILQEEEAYIAYLSGVINEYPEKCLRRVGAYLRYIISARWGRPDHPLNREELYLSLVKTQFIPSGDPSSDITIDGTAKAEFVDVKMYGDTFQQSYTGKNLWTYSDENWFFDAQNTSYEITQNGELKVTATAGTYQNSDFIVSLADGTYTFSLGSVSVSNPNMTTKRMTLSKYNSDHSGRTIVKHIDEGTPQTVTIANETGKVYALEFWATYASSISNTTTFSNVQIEAGSTATAYEPFVGGVPSPNLSYPQPIQTVTGEQTVEVHGKNLIGLTDGTISQGGLTATIEGDTITINGASTGAVVNICSANYALAGMGGKKPAVSIFPISGSWTGGAIGFSLRNSSNTQVFFQQSRYDGLHFNANTLTESALASADHAFIFAGATTVFSNFKFKIMLSDSPAIETTFVPYSKHAYTINLGKNLFDYYGLPLSDRFLNGNGVMETGTTHYKNQEIAVTGGETFYWSSEAFGSNASTYLRLGQFNGNTFISRNLYRSNASITLDKNTTRVVLSVDYEPSLDRYFTNPMFAKGSTSTAYAPYFEPIELCKLGTYQDYIWKDGDSWKVHKAIGKYIFTGEEDMSFDSSIPRVYIGYPVLNSLGIYPVYPLNVDTLPMAVNSKFTGKTFTAFYTNSESNGFAMSTSGRNFNFGNKSWETSTQARSDISGNICYYAKASSYITDTIITNQALIDQLEALVKGGSEEGTTYIKLSTPEPNLPGLLYVEAAKYVE